MDFDDQLPCGGYEQEDKKIQKNLQTLSLQSQNSETNRIQQSSCEGCQCSCECGENLNTKKIEEIVKGPKKIVLCKKCKQNSAVLIHKNEQICRECLMKNIEYKTRLTLQNKIHVGSKSKLLLCFSGGLNSICLVQIMNNIKKRYQKSPLFGHIQCLHIQQQSNLPENYVQNFEKNTNIKLNVVSISNIYGKQVNADFNNVVKLFKGIGKNSNSLDLLTLFRNKLIREFAKENNFDFVMFAKNGESLASEIFKYFTKGIGGNSPALCSSEKGQFQYPLRQHLQKQLQYYFYYEKLSKLSLISKEDDLSNIASNEVDSFLDSFIANLQSKYSHTAPAIVRTGQKLKSNFSVQKQCQWCSLKHNRTESLCQKCLRLKEYIKDEYVWKLMPKWTVC